jgi:glycosyltransferase involved in cell wall biosynthesis
MKVLFAQPYPRDVTLGSPKLFLRLGAALSALGHDVEYVFLSDLPAPLRRQRLLYVAFPLYVAARAADAGYDLLHVASGDAFLAAAVGRLLRRKRPQVVNQVLGLEHLHWEQLQGARRQGEEHVSLRHSLWFGGLRLAEVEASIRFSRHVFCLCDQDRASIVAHGWRAAGGVTIVPPGVDTAYLQAPPARLDSQTILFLGSWTFRKGIRNLVAAFARVVEQVPGARLVVAGAHAPPETVLASFPEGARAAVYVAPPATEEELLAVMQESAAMVLPSLYEGFGIAFLEAMAVGVPVIGTPTGGMADLIESGVNGLLVPHHDRDALAEAMICLLREPEQRAALGRAARRMAAGYTWEQAAQTTATVYRACLEDGLVPASRPQVLAPEQPVGARG